VKAEVLGNKKDVRTMKLYEYKRKVDATFQPFSRMFREGPMREISLVGKRGEETGSDFSDYTKLLQGNIPIMKWILPWGRLALDEIDDPNKSDDGPIWWVRPGEQSVSCQQGTPIKANLGKVGVKRARDSRELNVIDRTYPHLDHQDNPRRTTHAVGVLKAVKCGKSFPGDPVQVKDAVLFDSKHKEVLINALQIDTYEPPMTQTSGWLSLSKLNGLRSDYQVNFTRVELYDDDIYLIPRILVHQFRSTAAISSVAWHVRLQKFVNENVSK
jgi:hypothetical protein